MGLYSAYLDPLAVFIKITRVWFRFDMAKSGRWAAMKKFADQMKEGLYP